MKGLLHSKRFRANLYKWLRMYLSVLLLFTGVVTYSKYVSSIGSNNDEARAAKFKITINDANDFDCDDYSDCSTGIQYADDYQAYNFTVETNKLEVKTDLILLVYVNKNFDANIVGYTEMIEPDTGEWRYYRFEYNNLEPDGSREPIKLHVEVRPKRGISLSEPTNYNTIKIGYSAIQVD